jgi:hypothetical protein
MQRSHFIKLVLFIFVSAIMLSSTPARAESVGEALESIKNEQCPCQKNFSCNKRVAIPIPVKNNFIWTDHKKILVFDKTPSSSSFPETKYSFNTSDHSKDYALQSLRLIPPKVLKGKYVVQFDDQPVKPFLIAYRDGLARVAAAKGTTVIDIDTVVSVFTKLAECCFPKNPQKPNEDYTSLLPTNYDDLFNLIASASTQNPSRVKRVTLDDLEDADRLPR